MRAPRRPARSGPARPGDVAVLVSVAALSAIAALSWTAAEGGRGLSWSDFRSVVIVTLAVLVATIAIRRDKSRQPGLDARGLSEPPVADHEQRHEGTHKERRGQK